MKYWEFLIQKEGDETWLPLETQQVEILAGRYRVVAHTDRIDTQMEIRVSQLMTQEMPPRKRVRKRIGQTNDAGLVVVMPYVHLKPGQWELRCSSLSDRDHPPNHQKDSPTAQSPDWQYQVQLQVFAPTEDDWSEEWPIPADAATAHSTLVEISDTEAALTSLPKDMPLIQAQARLQAQLEAQIEAQIEDTQVYPGQSTPPSEAAQANSAYCISLKQQAFLAHRNQAMTIIGQVQARADFPALDGVSQLWLRLQNPETAQVIMEAHRPLSLDRLPADFKVKIQLPANVKTRVVLGEVSLRMASIDAHAPDAHAPDAHAPNAHEPDAHKPAKILSSTAFTITAGIAQLLDEIASRDLGQFDEEVFELADSQTEQSEPDLVSPILNPTHRAVVPAVGVVLPPKLERDDAFDYAIDRPELPAFANGELPLQVSDRPAQRLADDSDHGSVHSRLANDRSAEPMSESTAFDDLMPLVSQPAQFMSTSIEDDGIEASQIAALLEDIDGDLASQPVEIDDLELPSVEAALPERFPSDVAKESRSKRLGEPLLPLARPANKPFAGVPVAASADESSTDESSTDESLGEVPAAASADEVSPADQFPTRTDYQRQQQSQRQSEASTAFKSLKLKDHFWQRLSNLTHESRDQAAELAQNIEAAGVSPRAQQPGSAGALIPSATEADIPANSEVVIYNRLPTAEEILPDASTTLPTATTLPAATTSRRRALPPTTAGLEPLSSDSLAGVPVPPSVHNAAPASSGVKPVANSAIESTTESSTEGIGWQTQSGRFSRLSENTEAELPEMALPVISVPTGDLIAGGTVTITVRSQPSAYKPFIKLWMIDRQSRTLVGEPKLMMNLQPDTLGYLETSTELRVPMGCLDVQIAAIAIDMATQQESNKAIVNRHVVPSSQSLDSLRNF